MTPESSPHDPGDFPHDVSLQMRTAAALLTTNHRDRQLSTEIRIDDASVIRISASGYTVP